MGSDEGSGVDLAPLICYHTIPRVVMKGEIYYAKSSQKSINFEEQKEKCCDSKNMVLIKRTFNPCGRWNLCWPVAHLTTTFIHRFEKELVIAVGKGEPAVVMSEYGFK